jgi:hypothetical protein
LESNIQKIEQSNTNLFECLGNNSLNTLFNYIVNDRICFAREKNVENEELVNHSNAFMRGYSFKE